MPLPGHFRSRIVMTFSGTDSVERHPLVSRETMYPLSRRAFMKGITGFWRRGSPPVTQTWFHPKSSRVEKSLAKLYGVPFSKL
jgi:hypothetical protein